MSIQNLLNIILISATFAFVASLLFRFSPVQALGNAAVGSLVGVCGAFIVGALLNTSNDAYIVAGILVSVLLQILLTRMLFSPRSRRPAGSMHSSSRVSSAPNTPSDADSRPNIPPESESKKVFLSYRRSDSADVIGRIYDRLVSDLGETAVFKDVDSIPLGVDFRTHIATQLDACEVFLAVIGKDWLQVQDQDGRRRLDDPRDHVRLETLAALGKAIPVVPVLVSGARMPVESELPTALADLSFRNGIAIRPDPDFHRDMDRLLAQIRS